MPNIGRNDKNATRYEVGLEEQIAHQRIRAEPYPFDSPMESAILASLTRLKEIEGRLRETYEIYAGMEGIPLPQTACEAYLLRIIDEMQKSIALLLRGRP